MTPAPAVPTDNASPRPEATVLENTRYQIFAVTQYTVPDGETLYARWLSAHEYPNADDLYVVTF